MIEATLRQKLTIQTASKLGAQFIKILANKGSYFDFENVQTNSQKLVIDGNNFKQITLLESLNQTNI